MTKTRNRSGKVALWLAAGVVILLLLLPAGIIIGFTAQGYSCFAVATGSMHPTLPIGTLVEMCIRDRVTAAPGVSSTRFTTLLATGSTIRLPLPGRTGMF